MRFDEQAYLEANPDVAAAIAGGDFASGLVHWELHGRHEGRARRSRWNADRGRIVIAGTGRAGTTLLVQLFTRLDFQTGFEKSLSTCVVDPISHGGLEHELHEHSPLVVKSPWLADVLSNKLESIPVNFAIVPIREVEKAAESRRRVHDEAIRQGLNAGSYPGSLWLTDRPEDQERVLEKQFYKTVYALVAAARIFAVLCCLSSWSSPSLAAETFVGVPQVSDADTVIIGGRRLRLYGGDAPETYQKCLTAKDELCSCGVAASVAMKKEFGGKQWRCVQVGYDGTWRALLLQD